MEETSKHGQLGRHKTCSTERFLVQSNTIAIILYDTLTAYCMTKAVVMGTGEIFFEKVHASSRPPPKISFKDNWMKDLDSEVAGGTEDPQKFQLLRTETPVKSEKPSGSLTQEIEKGVLSDYESTNVRTGGPVKSCVSVSVDSFDKDKDADENVDADQSSTGKPVSGQSIGLFTQREEIDIHFRVSGLPHAVVKQAENFRVRELVNQIESHLHGETLQ